MAKKPLLSLLALAILALNACHAAVKIDRHPSVDDWHRGAMTVLPTYDPNSYDPWQMDLRAYDLSNLDLHDSLDDLLYATFDDRTVWPSDDRMPQDFDRQRTDLGHIQRRTTAV